MKKFFKNLIISFIAFCITFLLSVTGVLSGLDYILTDALYQRPGVVDTSNIKIIAIDEKSLDELGAFNTWDRSLYADLLNTLYKKGSTAPELVVFDMIFQGETNKSSDKAFAEAAKNAGGIVCATNMVYRSVVETDENGKHYENPYHIELIEYPYDELLKNCDVGFADTKQEKWDNSIRRFIPYLNSNEDKVFSSLSVKTAEILHSRGKMDINIPETSPGKSLIIRYNGKAGDYDAIPFVDVVKGNIAPEIFSGCTVFVGAYAPGMMDSFNVPSDKGNQMHGVEVHANILQSIGMGRYMVDIKPVLYSFVFAAIVFLFMLLTNYVHLIISLIIAVVLIVGEIVWGVKMADNHMFLPLIVLPFCLVLALISSLIYKYIGTLLQRKRVLKAFKQYVAPQVVEEIAKEGSYELKLGGEKRDIAVLFVDIRGFTPLSEALEPEQVVSILNEYLALTTKSIFDNMGTLDKFVGDATMAVFNSPFDLDDYIYRAVCAARDIVLGSEDIRKKAFELTGKEVGFGVGVNCGPAVVGNIGCDFRMDYTAIGDTVNTAARLEANAKAGQVLLSPTVVNALENRINTNPVGEINLKGKKEPMMVYELIDIEN